MSTTKFVDISLHTVLSAIVGTVVFSFAATAVSSESGDLDPTAQTIVEQDRERIRAHLRSVEQRLRAKDASDLSPEQRRARERNLDRLREYWKRGVFPHNVHAEGKTPVFIDDDGRHCAVGYLMKESGWDDEAQAIASRENLARLPEMESPEVEQWVEQSGLTAKEATLIQPSYCYLDSGPMAKECGDTGTGEDTQTADTTSRDTSHSAPDSSESDSGGSGSDTSADWSDSGGSGDPEPERVCSTAPSPYPSPLFALGLLVVPAGLALRDD